MISTILLLLVSEVSAQTNLPEAVRVKQVVNPTNAFVVGERWWTTNDWIITNALGLYPCTNRTIEQFSGTNVSTNGLTEWKPENVTNLIQRLAKEGEICKVLGHQWRDGRPGEGEGSPVGGWFADYHPNTSYRTCRMCGKCQSQMYEWKETP
jgi:hypothetical protein